MYEEERGLCGACHTRQCAEDDRSGTHSLEQEHILESSFMTLCPSIYQETDEKKLPQPYFELKHYALNSKGILCKGPSRTHKTRSCWMMLRRLHLEGIKIIALTETQFAQESARLHRCHEIDHWLKRLCFCPLLFLDDIGHVAANNQHLQELLHVVEQRTSWKRPIIATTQYTGDELKSKTYTHAAKTVEAIVGRLREFCEVIEFS